MVEFYGRHERISEKQDGSLVGRTPGFVVSTVNCLSTIYVLSWLFLSQAIFPFRSFCFHNFSPPPLQKSWLRPCCGVARGVSMKFGLWTFHKLLKRQKNFDFIDFWLPQIWLYHFESAYSLVLIFFSIRSKGVVGGNGVPTPVWCLLDYIKTWVRSHRCASDMQIRSASQKSKVKQEDPVRKLL